MKELTASTLQGATMLMSSQGLSRLLTFIGNVLLVRSMNNDPAPLGVSSTQFHLLYVAGISFTREGLRRACLRQLPADIHTVQHAELQTAISLAKAYSLVAACVLLPLALAYFATRTSNDHFQDETYLGDLVLVFCGSLFEVLAEPLYIVAQSMQWFQARSTIFTIQSTSRVFTGLALSLTLGWRLQAFAAGYFMGGLVMLISYSYLLRNELITILFQVPSSFLLNTELGNLAKLTTVQSSWKVLLSEGENLLLLTTVSNAEDRGAFAIASGLGSIAARLILQPCEEAAFTLFGKLESNLVLFPVLMRAAQVFAGVFSCLAINYTRTLTLLLYGASLAEVTSTWISYYCVFIAICAINGISEAFLQAKINEQETNEFNIWLLMCSCMFLTLANFWFVPAMGSGGLIVANCVVMMLRVARNLQFAMTRLPGLQAGMLLLPWQVYLTFAASYWITSQSYSHMVLHITVGGLCGLLVLSLVYLFDKQLVSTLNWRRVKHE